MLTYGFRRIAVLKVPALALDGESPSYCPVFSYRSAISLLGRVQCATQVAPINRLCEKHITEWGKRLALSGPAGKRDGSLPAAVPYVIVTR